MHSLVKCAYIQNAWEGGSLTRMELCFLPTPNFSEYNFPKAWFRQRDTMVRVVVFL